MAALGETYRRWAAGDCPCCGAGISSWIDGTAPQVVAEGVRLCGRCIANEHDEPAILTVILTALVTRSDEPIERRLASLG